MTSHPFTAIATKAAVVTLLLITYAGCSGAHTKPDDMSADEHRARAAAEGAVAREQADRFDGRARAADPLAVSGNVTGGVVEWPVTDYNPTGHYLSEATRHQEAAAAHLAAARVLEKFERGECKNFPAQTRAACPLRSPIQYWAPLPNGVRLTVRKGVPMAAIAAHTRCHFAFGRAHGHASMPDCPLYVGKVSVKVNAAQRTLDLTVTGVDAVAELQRRTNTHATRQGALTNGVREHTAHQH